MVTQSLIPVKYVLNSPISSVRFEEQVLLILKWARSRESRFVCLANVHMLMEAYWHTNFAKVLKTADLVAPDGMPLVWMLRHLGMYSQDRVAGMDVFLQLCQLSSLCKVSIFLVGSQAEVLEQMQQKLEQDFPNLEIAGMEPLPFRPLTPVEDLALVDKINKSGAGIVLVCLGCPKQEYWMVQHHHKIQAVMIGVGAVFSVYAGIQKRAPGLIRDFGLEWLYRLLQEPRRLWYRYIQTIPPFIFLVLQELLLQNKSQFSDQFISNFLAFANDHHFLIDQSDLLFVNLEHSKIGEILLRQNFVSKNCLSIALEEQRQTNRKLGEILIELKYISELELAYHLKNQKIKLGELLVDNKVISKYKLNRILAKQKSSNKKLGEIILQQKILSDEQLQQFLMEQYWRKQGLWLVDKKDVMLHMLPKRMSEKPLLLPFENRSSTKESDLQLSKQPLLDQLGMPRDTSQTSSKTSIKV